MALSPYGPLTGGTAVDAGGPKTWSTVSNALVEDGSVATALNVGPGGGGGFANQLIVKNMGFSIPSTAIIDGIKLEAKVQTTGGANGVDVFSSGSRGVCLNFNGGATSPANTPNQGQFWPVSALTWLTWGGPTSLWGKVWTGADISDTNFGAQLAAQPTTGTANINVDSVRITVWWHVAPHEIPRLKYYLYKVYDSLTNQFLGCLPNVSSEFAFSQDINSIGSQISVSCASSVDISALPTSPVQDEAGNILTDESNNTLYFDGISSIIDAGTSGALIRNGNTVKVYEYGYYNPNGLCLFSGVIEKVDPNLGGDTGANDTVLTIYSDGSDMDNHLVRGSPFSYTLDQSQTSQNTAFSVTQLRGSFNSIGQTWQVGVGVTNVGAVSLLLNGTANVSISIYDNPSLVTFYGSTSQFVSVGSPTEVQFTIPLHIAVTAGNSYFFAVTVDDGQTMNVYYQNTNVYANGQAYSANFGGGSGGGSYSSSGTTDLYFKTFSTNGSTIATFTGVDPSTGMLQTVINDYVAEGGKISIGNIQSTGLSLNYGFNTNNVSTGVQSALTIAPSGFYFYVDLGADLLYFQQVSNTPDFTLTKGVHFSKLAATSTIEYVSNAAYVIGALVSGSNIYTFDFDATSIARYGLRLQVHTDNNIPDTATAHAVGASLVADNKDEQFQCTFTIPDRTIDVRKLIPGKVVALRGFGTYIDNIQAEIVHRDYTSQGVTITVGKLPTRQSTTTEQILRNLITLSTVSNPTSPS